MIDSHAPIDFATFEAMARAGLTAVDPLVELFDSKTSEADKELWALLNQAMLVNRAGVAPIGAEPMVHQTSGTSGFFRVASNAVTGRRIRSDVNEQGYPEWLGGVCWRPSLCVDIEIEDIDCATCGNSTPLVDYTFPNKPENQTAKAFEVTLRDLNDLSTTPLTADSLRMKLGIAFGRQLWKQVMAAGIAVPVPASGLAFAPEWAVAQLEYDTQFVGNGTLLVPSLLTSYLVHKDAIVETGNGDFRTANGNRVLTEGIPLEVPGTTAGAMRIAMVGPIDYARTVVDSGSETMRSRGNDIASSHQVQGLVRTDLCAAKQISATVPDGCVIPETL